MTRGSLAAAFAVLAAVSVPASASDDWDFAVAGIVGASLPLEVNGLRIQDRSVPLDLTIDGNRNEKALVLGGRLQVFKRRDDGPELGLCVDVRTFRYNGEAGVPTHVYGTVAGERVDDIEISEGDQTRVTMILGALMLRYPLGRTSEQPEGRVVPYIGVGGGNQHANIMSAGITTDAPTWQVLAGAELRLDARFGVFGEYRYESLHDMTTDAGTEVDIRLRTHHVAGGVAFHF